jgi:hypothetical protein
MRPRQNFTGRATLCGAGWEPEFWIGLESRLQRLFTLGQISWGVAPGCHETAPLARKANERVKLRLTYRAAAGAT